MANLVSIEELGPVPRRLRRKAAPVLQGMGCLRIFILPFIAVGIGMLGAALFGTLMLLIGQTAPGQITGRDVHQGDDGPEYRLMFSYAVGGAQFEGRAKVDGMTHSTMEDGTAVTVRYLPLLPGTGAQLLVPGSKHNSVLFYWGFALLWNGIVSMFVWMAYVAPVVHRRLVQYGAPVQGRVRKKTVNDGDDSTTYHVEYEYAPATSPLNNMTADSFTSSSISATLHGKMDVRKGDYEAIGIGDAVTVLHNPKRPQSSLIYQFADYEVV